MPYAIVDPVREPLVRAVCARAYPGHPKGCPNFRKKEGCPPKAPMLYDVLDLGREIWAIWNVFDFAGHVARMREQHPAWSKRQLECCLYWQPAARKALRSEIVAFLIEHDNMVVITCPEACGVNMTDTMRKIGHDLEWPPETVTYQIALAGFATAPADPRIDPRRTEWTNSSSTRSGSRNRG